MWRLEVPLLLPLVPVQARCARKCNAFPLGTLLEHRMCMALNATWGIRCPSCIGSSSNSDKWDGLVVHKERYLGGVGEFCYVTLRESAPFYVLLAERLRKSLLVTCFHLSVLWTHLLLGMCLSYLGREYYHETMGMNLPCGNVL